MVPGVRGDLISGAYLARPEAGRVVADPAFNAWVRGFIRWRRRAARVLGPASGHRIALDIGARPLLTDLGFSLVHVEQQAWGYAGVISAGHRARAVLLGCAWRRPPETAWREAARLGLTAGLSWAIVFTGTELAIVDCRRPWTRRSMAFDLDVAAADPEAAAALWTLARADALDDRNGECPLARAVAESDRHGVEVCGLLGAGVLDALGALVTGLDDAGRPGRRSASPHRSAAIFDQSLTVVYRLLFLFFAEARGLVPTWHDVYREAYGMEALCDRLLTELSGRGTWASLQAISRLAHAGCRTPDLEVTAFNGRLFAPARTPLAECRHLSESAARHAVLALGTTPTPDGRARIRFDDLGVEQLGSVYERVLEMEPVREDRALKLRRTSTDRKTSGSFYTPRAVTDFVVRRTLGPLIDGRDSEGILRLRIVDPAMGSGAFLVAACRYLAARAEQALIAEGTWPEFDIPDADRAELRRTIAERCLYGVDQNPTAVQLTRLSLWLTTLAANRPLTFLDHHISAGNSLIGARLADILRPPGARPGIPAGDRQLPLFDDADADGMRRAILPERLRLALDPSHTAHAVRDKERRLDRLQAGGGPLARWRLAADLWCGLQLDPVPGISAAMYAELLRHVAGLDTSAQPRHLQEIVDRAVAAARREQAFHWELAFPEVFAEPSGDASTGAGFDAVIGNPPWEMLRADTGDGDARAHARERTRSFARYARTSGHYALQGSGHANQYQLFLERSLRLLRPGGRVGLILPSGIESDVGSVELRRALIDTCRVDTWLSFDNRHAIFPVHRGIRFVIVSATREGVTGHLPVIAGLTEASDLSRLPDLPRSPHAGLAPTLVGRRLLERFDPAHLTVPRIANAVDLAILARALEAPPLSSRKGWSLRFGRELNATDDKIHFEHRYPSQDSRVTLPIVEGKHLRPFGLDLERVTTGIDPAAAARLIDPASSFGRARVCYRDVASATNRVTLIAAVLPAGTLSTHTVFCTKARLGAADRWCLTALLNSLVANYLVRLQMSTHVTSALMARLPVPRPQRGSAAHRALGGLARQLSTGTIDDQPAIYARLNAIAAGLYGLSRTEYEHVVGSFPLLGDTLRAHCLGDDGRVPGR